MPVDWPPMVTRAGLPRGSRLSQKMRWVGYPPHSEGVAAAAAAGRAPHGPRPGVALPPRCEKEREARGTGDVEESTQWRWAAKKLFILTVKESCRPKRAVKARCVRGSDRDAPQDSRTLGPEEGSPRGQSTPRPSPHVVTGGGRLPRRSPHVLWCGGHTAMCGSRPPRNYDQGGTKRGGPSSICCCVRS